MMAERRANEALARLRAGESLARSEAKLAYNGADGVPIREEVLSRHGEEVVTRNAYGAHCLNSPDALFADLDFTSAPRWIHVLYAFIVLAAVSMTLAWGLGHPGLVWLLLVLALVFANRLAVSVHRLWLARQGGEAALARRRLLGFLAAHPDWNVRVYETPAGWRLLVTHQGFEADAAPAPAFFAALGADPLYVRMCRHQRCFRARLTAKPWRIGIAQGMRPRPGVWPIASEHRAVRQAWVENYEARAADFAACRYLESLGSGAVAERIKPVIELHDEASRACVPGLMLA